MKVMQYVMTDHGTQVIWHSPSSILPLYIPHQVTYEESEEYADMSHDKQFSMQVTTVKVRLSVLCVACLHTHI